MTMARGGCALLLLLAVTSGVQATSLQLEHSLDGGRTYAAAGTITVRTSVSLCACCSCRQLQAVRIVAA